VVGDVAFLYSVIVAVVEVFGMGRDMGVVRGIVVTV
jgi:hypothetical protein